MRRRINLLLLAAAAATLGGCNNVVECASGQVRYAGRPPRVLFADDRTCREDCFSLPEHSDCHESCDDVVLDAPTGYIVDERTLIVADSVSLGGGRALFFEFGFVDMAGGSAPAGWGILSGGARTYLADEIEGTARFDMQTWVTADSGAWDPASNAIPASPGRLEILSSDGQRLQGKFFLGYQTATEQAQGEVIGCFDLGVGPVQDVGGTLIRALGP